MLIFRRYVAKSLSGMKKLPCAQVRAKRGRPTLCTPALTEKICKLLADANTIAASCESLGIGTSTFHEWQHKNPDFADAATRARAEARIKLVKEIKRCSCDDWRGWAWLAERMFPGEFGRSEPRTIVIERPPTPPIVPVLQTEKDREKITTVEWIGREIPFSQAQLRYLATLKSHPPNGNGELSECKNDQGIE
jgi:hypothetical protein